ncbi:MAG: hypothetical protein GY913_22290 [Proteobacteria bacterium]|nr:hypothetical protein [Pseudomonadota bacterium]MCP4919641.1 hypothetical protein [Pseudomonadota bacterium]
MHPSTRAEQEAAALDVRGDPGVALAQVDAALVVQGARPEGPDRHRSEALLHARAAVALRKLGDTVEAASRALKAEELAGAAADPVALATARIALGQVYFHIGHLEEARRNLERAAETKGVTPRLVLQARMNTAAAWRSEGRLDRAVQLFDALIATPLRGDELWASVLINAASAWHQVDRTLEAQEALDEAVLCTERPDLLRWCSVIGAWIAAREGDVGSARRLVQGWEDDTLDLVSSAVRAWADAALRAGHQMDVGRARLAVEDVLDRAHRAAHRREERELHEVLAALAEDQEDLLGAVRHLRAAGAIRDEVQRGSAGLALEQEQLRVELVRMQAEADSLREHQAELSAARDRLQAAEASGRRQAWALAHDLRNPLMGIQAHLELLRPDEPADVRRRAEAIERTLARVESMLDTAVDASGSIVQAVDAVPIVLESCESFQALARTKDQSVVVVAPGRLPIVGSRRELGRVLDNLLSNAVKYSPGGTTIRVTLQAREGVAELRVEDEGKGFPSLSVEDGLVYGAKLGSRVTGGESSSGLGLNAVHELVSRMGGTIALGNRPDRGAVVRITLRRAGD